MPSDSNQKIDDFLDRKPAPKQEVETYDPKTGELVPIKTTDPDFDLARKNVKEVIEIGMEAINDLKQNASQSQQARDYEVLDRMVTTMIQANRSLLDMNREERMDTEEQDKPSAGPVNNILILSPDELLKRLKPAEEDEME